MPRTVTTGTRSSVGHAWGPQATSFMATSGHWRALNPVGQHQHRGSAPFRHDCSQAAARGPTHMDNSGISTQPTTGDGRSWTMCPLLRICECVVTAVPGGLPPGSVQKVGGSSPSEHATETPGHDDPHTVSAPSASSGRIFGRIVSHIRHPGRLVETVDAAFYLSRVQVECRGDAGLAHDLPASSAG
jgi:hypothetical protein